MEDNILSLVEKAKDSSKYYDELSQLIQIDIAEIPYFIDQYLIFEYLGKYAKTQYVNCFNCEKIIDYGDIISFELKHKKHQNYTFYKCVSIYLSQKMKDNNCMLLNIIFDEDLMTYIEILKLMPAEKFQYDYRIDGSMFYEDLLEILKYVKNIKNSICCGYNWRAYIDELQELDFIPRVELEEIYFDEILNYSRKYPNRIQKLEVKYFGRMKELAEIIELNQESLTFSFFYDLYHFLICKHLTGITTGFFEKELIIPDEMKHLYIFPNITKAEMLIPYGISSYSPKEKQMFVKVYLSYYNTFPNLTHLHFISDKSDISDVDVLILFLFGLKSKKLRTIEFTGRINDSALDFDPIIQHFPELETFRFNSFNQEVIYIFEVYAGRFTEIDYPNLEKLILNYLNTNPNVNISLFFLSFTMLEYFQYKTYLCNRIKTIGYLEKLSKANFKFKKCDVCILRTESDIPFYSHFENIDSVKIREEAPVRDEEIIEFLLKVKPYVIFYENNIVNNALRQFLKYKSNIKIIYNRKENKFLYAEKIIEKKKRKLFPLYNKIK